MCRKNQYKVCICNIAQLSTLGEFGIVYKGYIVKEQGSIVTDTVAVKTLKGIDFKNNT